MNALRAVSLDRPGTDSDGFEDLTDYPETAPEALVLCGLMWSRDSAESRRIASTLASSDFLEPRYRQLYVVVQELVLTDAPHDPASVLAVLVRSGADGYKGALLRRALTDVTTANASGASATAYADTVLSESYRRSFHDAGVAIQLMAEQVPEDELFERLVQIGRAQRTAANRLHTFRSGGTA